MLHAEVQGSGPRVALLHGFTQTSESWAPVATRLAESHEVVRLDLPGHGRSSDVRGDLATTARLAVDLGGRATWVGYSMGGRVALRLALDHPGAVDRLVLIGATAGIDDPEERAARRRADESLAATIEEEGRATGGVDGFLDRWLAQPLFAGLLPDPADLESRRSNTPAGLAASLRDSGTGTMDPPWWPELPAIGAAGIPVVVVVGGTDARFTILGDRLCAGIGPGAAIEVIPDAGHACHLHAPLLTFDVLHRHLS